MPSPDRDDRTGYLRGPDLPDRIARLNDQAALIFGRIHAELQNDANVMGGRCVSPYDLLHAASNGISPEINYSIPGPPRQARDSLDQEIRAALRSGAIPPDTLLVTNRDNPIFFQHVVWSLNETGRFPPAVVKQVELSGVAGVNTESYFEYLEILQATSRYLRRESVRLAPQLAEFIAVMAIKDLIGGQPPLASMPQLIEVSSAHNDGLALDVMKSTFVQRLRPGARVMLAGAGYNALRDLPAMQAAEKFQFVLNDKDPFVSQILEHAIALSSAQNISFIGGDMSTAIDRCPPLDAIFVSNVPSASEAEVIAFAKAAGARLKPGSPVHVCQVEKPAVGTFVAAAAWTKLLEINGFAKILDDNMGGSTSVVSPEQRMALMEKSAEDLIETLSTPSSLREKRSFRYYVGRLMGHDERSGN